MCESKHVFNEKIKLKGNAMLERRKELFYEWDFEKNDELGLDVYEITFGSGRLAWWRCPKCDSPYDMSIVNRTTRNQKCPYCAGQRVNHTNSLATLMPELAKEWHPTKNGDFTPDKITLGSDVVAWWIGECGHEWDMSVDKRTKRGCGCPYCAPFNARILIGFNDMWTTNPELAKQLADPEDGYRHTQFSNKKVDWICLVCRNPIRSKWIQDIGRRGVPCPKCSDGVSFGEKFIYNLLKVADIEFKYNVAQKWSQGKRYDFYFELMEKTYIIEVHGKQHYEESPRGRSLAKEQANDKLKYQLAKKYGADRYIVIDARESTVEWMRNSILNSDVTKLIPEIDFERIGGLATNSFVKDVCEMWNSGARNVLEISDKMKIGRTTVVKYLKRGVEIGWCDYSRELSNMSGGMKRSRPVIQLSIDREFLGEWSSIKEASLCLGVSPHSISQVCSGELNTAGNYYWLYKENYAKYLSGEICLSRGRRRSVVQLDKNLSLIQMWSSIADAVANTGVRQSGISSTCSGKQKTAGGFKWMYKEDYEKEIESQSIEAAAHMSKRKE